MIKSIKLINFQGHVRSILDLGPGINVINGESDSGKSSILRGLWWLIHNRPTGAGDKYRNLSAKEGDRVSVAITLDDHSSIERFKEKQANGYIVDGQELKAIQKSVPLEVSSIMNLADYNFQTQHPNNLIPAASPLFLLADPPGDVAKRLNKVCNLGIIDDTLKSANSVSLSIGQEFKAAKDNAARLNQSLGRYVDLDAMEDALAAAEMVDQNLKLTTAEADGLVECVKALRSTSTALAIYDKLVAAESDPAMVMALRDQDALKLVRQEIHGLGDSVSILKSIQTDLDACTARIAADPLIIEAISTLDTLDAISGDCAALNEFLVELKKIDIDLHHYDKIAQAGDQIAATLAEAEELAEVKAQIADLGELIETNTRLDRDIQDKEVEVERLEAEVRQALEDEGVCPLCMQSTTVPNHGKAHR